MWRRWNRFRSLDVDQRRVVVVSAALLPAIHLSLKTRGFVATSAMLARRSDHSIVAPDVELAHRIAEAVGLVAGQSVIGAKCLVRSLALWFLLRRRGIDADLVIGAESPAAGVLPAHAWVELLGAPVNDVADVRDRFGSFGLRLPRLDGGGS